MDAVYIQIILGLFSAVAGGIVAWIGWKLQKRVNEREEKDKRRQQEHDTAEALRRAETEAMREGILAILRERLIDVTTKCEHDGHVRVYQVENVSHMFRAYEALGGNGMITHMFQKFKELPVVGGADE